MSKLKTATQVHAELSLEAALHEVKNGQSVNGAAKTYGVCRSTLRNRTYQPNPSRVGAPTKFPSWEEDRIADFLLSCSDQGIPLNRYHCIQLLCEVAAGLGKLLLALFRLIIIKLHKNLNNSLLKVWKLPSTIITSDVS